MSVINTMLKDLEQRQGQTLSGRYLPPTPRRLGPSLIAGLLLLVVLPAVAYGVWHIWLRPAGPQAANPAPTTEPTPAEPTPTTASSTLEKSTSQPVVEAQEPMTQVQSAATASVSAAVVTPAVAPEQADSPRMQAKVSSPVAVPTPSREPAQATDVATLPAAEPAESAELEDALLGPDEGPQVTEASAPEAEFVEEPKGSLEIAEEMLSPQQEAELERRKGLQAVSKGQLTQACDSFSRVLANDPLDHETRERLAGLLYGEGRLPEAQQVLAEGIRQAPMRADFRLMQARLAMASGNKAQALQTLSDQEPAVASNLDYYATRAALAQELEQPAIASRSYQQLVIAQPTEARWWLGLGISLDKQGRALAALDAYHKALNLPLSSASRQFVQQRIGQLE